MVGGDMRQEKGAPTGAGAMHGRRRREWVEGVVMHSGSSLEYLLVHRANEQSAAMSRGRRPGESPHKASYAARGGCASPLCG